MATDRQPIRTLLIKNGFEKMRDGGDNERREQDVIGCATPGAALAARIEPPGRSHRVEDMFIAPHVTIPATSSVGGLVCDAIISAIATSAFVGRVARAIGNIGSKFAGNQC